MNWLKSECEREWFCFYVSPLWLTGDLSRVYPASCPVSAKIGSSPPQLKDKRVQLMGRMEEIGVDTKTL